LRGLELEPPEHPPKARVGESKKFLRPEYGKNEREETGWWGKKRRECLKCPK
jgi:hypothetical protein